MGIEQIFSSDQYQVLKADLRAGSQMPEHHATSDAFVMVEKGKAELIFAENRSTIAAGSTFLIPGDKPHRLEIKEDFKAYILLSPGAVIAMEEKPKSA